MQDNHSTFLAQQELVVQIHLFNTMEEQLLLMVVEEDALMDRIQIQVDLVVEEVIVNQDLLEQEVKVMVVVMLLVTLMEVAVVLVETVDHQLQILNQQEMVV